MADPLVLINTFEVSRDYAERFMPLGRRRGITFPLSMAMWTPRCRR